jgi:hypothetical protein
MKTPTNIKNENYTPGYFIVPCYQFLNGFDLDPFMSKKALHFFLSNLANAEIPAPCDFAWWGEEDDEELEIDWSEYQRKWVNPPYSGGLITPCIEKTLKYTHIGETLLLVNSSTSAKWYQKCIEHCSAMLLPSKRIPFYNPYKEHKNNNLYNQTLFYFGQRGYEFMEKLKPLGTPMANFYRKQTLAEIEELALKGGLKV